MNPRLDVAALRAQFPLLGQQVNDKPLVYLDNAATTQKPLAVIEAIDRYYREYNSNVHRGAHALADRATQVMEQARESVRGLVNARETAEIVFTRGTTESINLVAYSWARNFLRAGDEVVISALEHHANLVPWQQACLVAGAKLRVIPINDAGELDLDAYRALLGPRTRLVACAHVSNALGTVNPVTDIVAAAKTVGALVLLDGAQAVSHFAVDVQALGCDFYVFSGHKLFGPTGTGVLWGRRELLEAMPPFQFGGEMIETVSFEQSSWNQLPYKFEAGTPHIAGIIGLGAAIDWLQAQDRAALAAHEDSLLQAVSARAAAIPGLRAVGTARRKVGVFSFLIDGAHPNDIGTLLDQQGVAVRTGHHCTMPLMQRLGIPGTVRASFSVYNNLDDVERFIVALEKARKFL
ncbi:MAG: aminotransferase class V-fold PLP-dependent enzyme [Gammaproteobacteria bacterium]